MLTLTADAASALARSWTMSVRVESWLADALLAEDVPVAAGSLEVDRTLRVPERVSLTVPRTTRDGASWDPAGKADHPLAAYGQELRVSVGIGLANGVVETLQLGWFTIASSETDGDTVTVEAVGQLGLIDEARFVAPFQPTGTFTTTLRALVEPALTVDLTAAPTDRAVPASMSWDEDRLGAVFELLDAWPAEARVDEAGVLVVTSATDPTVPVATVTDGTGGTVVRWQGSTSRDGAVSVVVARGLAADGTQVQGAAYDGTTALRYGGPFNPLPVPFFYFSPLLTTVAQCKAAARTVLARLRRQSSRRLAATVVPNPALQVGDLVSVTGNGLVAAPCLVEALTLPLTPDGGPMTLGLRVVS